MPALHHMRGRRGTGSCASRVTASVTKPHYVLTSSSWRAPARPRRRARVRAGPGRAGRAEARAGRHGAQVLQALVAEHQAARAKVTDEVLRQFTDVRPMPDLFASARARAAALAADGPQAEK